MPDETSRFSIRPTAEDRRILADLTKWLGLTATSVIRQALRVLHQQEQKRWSDDTPGATMAHKQ